jgi:hypothetical protein
VAITNNATAEASRVQEVLEEGPAADVIIEMAHTGCELLDLLKAHVAECAVCGSTKKITQGDRLALGTKGSVCCGEVA